MNFTKLIIKEVLHRKLNFCLSLTSVAIAVTCVIGSSVFLRSHELNTK